MERKAINFYVKGIDEATGVIEGYGATFSDKPDAYGDIIDHGAFTKTLKENEGNIVSLFNHYIMEPIGLPELSEDKNGLYAKIHLVMEIQKARDVLALAKAGVIKTMSIGYDTIKSEFIDGIRHLKEVKLYDVSPVIFAANPEARIVAVKAASTFDDLPLTSKDREWDASAAKRRVRVWAGGDNLNFDKYNRAFMWVNPDDPESLSSYKMGFADIVGGRLTAIPKGIFAAAEALSEVKGGIDIPDEDQDKAKTHCEKYYAKMRKEFADNTIIAPWNKSIEIESKEELKPYPNEHACRLREPDDFEEDSFRRMTRKHDGKEYSVIAGRLKDEDTLTDQAYRYDKEVWDVNEAKAHCADYDGKFEPAEKQEKSGRVLSAINKKKVQAAIDALRALLSAADGSGEPDKSTLYASEALIEAASQDSAVLDAAIAQLKAENEGFDVKEAERRIDKFLVKIRKGG